MTDTSFSQFKRLQLLCVGCVLMLSIGCATWAPMPRSQWSRRPIPDPAIQLDAPEGFDHQTEKPTERHSLPRTDDASSLPDASAPIDLPAPPSDGTDPPRRRRDDPAEPNAAQPGPDFGPSSSARRPNVELEIEAPAQKQTGTPVTFNLTVRNNGATATSPLLLVFEVEDPLICPNCEGRRLGQKIGSLGPGETKDLPVSVQSNDVGRFWCQLTLRDGDEEIAQKIRVIEFVSQKVLLDIVGPANRTVGSRAEFVIKVANTSTQDFPDFEVLVEHDGVLQQKEATVGAETTNHSLSWSRLGPLAAGEAVQLQVEFACPEVTDHADVTVTVSGSGFPSELRETRLQVSAVRGILGLQIEDRDDPISIGETTTHVITVHNRGLQVAQDVDLSIELPRGLEYIAGSVRQGDEQLTVAIRQQDQTLIFGKIGALRSDGALEYHVTSRGTVVGDVSVKASVAHSAARSDVETVEWTTINPAAP